MPATGRSPPSGKDSRTGHQLRADRKVFHHRPSDHRGPQAPARTPNAGPGVPRYREAAPSLKALALAAGRKQLHQLTWRHGTKTRPGNRTAAMKSRFLAIRIRPANRDIPRREDGSLLEAWMLAEWLPHEVAPTDY